MPGFGQQLPYYYQSPSAVNSSFPMQTQMVSQPIQGLIKVTGVEGAKAYQMPPNSVVPLFDANNDIMYIKSTDGAGFPTIREFTFSPVEMQSQADVDYVPRSEFNELVAKVKELINAQQSVPSTEQPTA